MREMGNRITTTSRSRCKTSVFLSARLRMFQCVCVCVSVSGVVFRRESSERDGWGRKEECREWKDAINRQSSLRHIHVISRFIPVLNILLKYFFRCVKYIPRYICNAGIVIWPRKTNSLTCDELTTMKIIYLCIVKQLQFNHLSLSTKWCYTLCTYYVLYHLVYIVILFLPL